MHDAHVHLDFMANGEIVAADAAAAGVRLFANTVTPEGYDAARERFADLDNARIGWGMHPWWVDDSTPPLHAPEGARFIGEVGLDFGKAHLESREAQLATFAGIARACAKQGDKVLSIHAVHAARETLDLLESCDTLKTCSCIFHWYSGPSDQLKRAIDAGCFFSVGPRMISTRKGREYVKAIPAKRLLLETDAPPGEGVPYSFSELQSELEVAVQTVAAIKGEGVLETLEDTFNMLFNQ